MPSPLVTITIDDFVRELSRLPDDGFPAAVGGLLAEHALDEASLAPYAFFSTRHYTRNLIFKDARVEVLALCWEPGQKSSIHNHRDQRCWMLMGHGRLENQNYRVLDRDEAARTCRLEESARLVISRDAPLAVEDDEPVHQIRNLEPWGTRALSVHLYARPFDSCEVYCPERGIYMDVPLSYWSRHGRLESASRG